MASKWPQPRENIQGIHRTRDDLLSLDDAALQRRVILVRIARELWEAVLRGAHGEHGRDVYQRMANPVMGDLVVESTTSLRHPGEKDADGDLRATHGFGILLGVREEWTCSHEEWKKDVEEAREDGYVLTEDDRAVTEAAYVQHGPMPWDVTRWVNAEMIALPAGMLYHTEDMQP